jgi:hypothetical protein
MTCLAHSFCLSSSVASICSCFLCTFSSIHVRTSFSNSSAALTFAEHSRSSAPDQDKLRNVWDVGQVERDGVLELERRVSLIHFFLADARPWSKAKFDFILLVGDVKVCLMELLFDNSVSSIHFFFADVDTSWRLHSSHAVVE